MEDKLRRYVDDLFDGTALTRKSVELKEEMIQNLNDKYCDLISEGKTPEAAYNIAVAGIGDVSGLLRELEDEAFTPDVGEIEAARRKSAMFTAIAVMMYILSVLPLIILNELGFRNPDRLGVPIMFIIIAGATGLLIYNNMTKPKYFKGSHTMVEEFREWQTDTHQRKSLRRSISSALWSIITVLYFVISFTTGAWHISWLIFIVGAALEAFINIFFSLKK
jgi:hypothetical protein